MVRKVGAEMTIQELATVLRKEQEVCIMAEDTAAGVYRYTMKDVPPALLSREVQQVVPRYNGEELIIFTERRSER